MKTARLALVLSEGSGNAAETERPGKETKPAHSMPRSAARVHNKNYSRENTQMEAQVRWKFSISTVLFIKLLQMMPCIHINYKKW